MDLDEWIGRNRMDDKRGDGLQHPQMRNMTILIAVLALHSILSEYYSAISSVHDVKLRDKDVEQKKDIPRINTVPQSSLNLPQGTHWTL